jgi:hypothetical protein
VYALIPPVSKVNTDQLCEFDLDSGFFKGFANSTLSGGFSGFDVAAGQAPDFKVFALGEENSSGFDNGDTRA